MTWIEWFWAFCVTQNPWLLPVLCTFIANVVIGYYTYGYIKQLRRVTMLRLPPVPDRFSQLDEIEDQRRQLVAIEKEVRDREARTKRSKNKGGRKR